MTFSVIITHGGRPEIRQTLESNIDFFCELKAEIVIGSTQWDKDLSAGLPSTLPLKVVERATPPTGAFNKSVAINAAFTFSSGERILLLDADIILCKEIGRALSELSFDSTYYILNGISETKPEPPSRFLRSRLACIKLETCDGRVVEVAKSKINLETGRFMGTGLISLSQDLFRRVGGFNEDLSGWGWEDVDFQVRLQLAGIQPSEIEVRGWHLTHGDDQRACGSAGKARSEAKNAARALVRYKDGDFLGTLQSRQRKRKHGWRLI